MKFLPLAAALALAAGPAAAQTAPGSVARPVAQVNTTQSGQPILLPQGPVQVTVTETSVPAGGAITPHKHPFPRYAYVLEGALKVTNLDTGTVTMLKAGDFAVEARDQWHSAEPLNGQGAKLLVIDQTPPGQVNMVRKTP
ncbi:MAG: cupin domain-containing protein [Phenylobacterium sp.]|uniref:cupin domain-containing protein n=1 Tax=Phenylobacterium sp. TaxID=1871053 RepID=UPI001B48B27A|nr:cupin domain-containing protein [Phenylobacterium sp.]MBP7817950.1 cupin domain-containing protein [Phenylobacterium sp.]MBP9230190.1 cupin domain-containing protein [Phenylobacterium sp.]MBP9755876.1 cupin domain-containing protein [Phenylobacterium sp.]